MTNHPKSSSSNTEKFTKATETHEPTDDARISRLAAAVKKARGDDPNEIASSINFLNKAANLLKGGCWVSTTGEKCPERQICDSRGCQLYNAEPISREQYEVEKLSKKCQRCGGSGFQAGYGDNHRDCVFCLGTGVDKTHLIESAADRAVEPPAPAQPAERHPSCPFKVGDRVRYIEEIRGSWPEATVTEITDDGFCYEFDKPYVLGTRLGSTSGGQVFSHAYGHWECVPAERHEQNHAFEPDPIRPYLCGANVWQMTSCGQRIEVHQPTNQPAETPGMRENDSGDEATGTLKDSVTSEDAHRVPREGGNK